MQNKSQLVLSFIMQALCYKLSYWNLLCPTPLMRLWASGICLILCTPPAAPPPNDMDISIPSLILCMCLADTNSGVDVDDSLVTELASH